MTVYSLVNKFNSQGITLWQENGKLKFKAPKGALTASLREELISNKEEIILFFQRMSERRRYPPILPINRTEMIDSLSEPFPLSFSQERLWFIDQLDPDSASYNMPKAVTISGELDIDHLEKAFSIIIARHENLRTIFISQEGKAQQVILDKLDFKLENVDLSQETNQQVCRDRAWELSQEEADTPFDLSKGPLIRGKLIKITAQEHILILTMHHIISDGWSMGVMIKEFGFIIDCLRKGKKPNLPALPVQYLDYSIWQRRLLGHGDLIEKQLAYWQNKLAGVEERLNLKTDYPRPVKPNFEGATQEFFLDTELTGELNALAEKHGATLYMVLMAAFKALFYRYTGQEDISFGGSIANRRNEETESLIGMFANTLVYRDLIDFEDSFDGLLTKVRATCLEAYENQDTPFEKVVDLVQPDRTVGISPLFQVMFVLHNVDMDLVDENIKDYPLGINVSRFDLIIHFTESSKGLDGVIVYKKALFKQQTIGRMAGHFVNLCRSIVAEPTIRVSDLSYIGEVERQALLLNNNQSNYPKDKCIHQLFVEQVSINPDNIAVVDAQASEIDGGVDSKQLTFQQLHDQSLHLALYLQSRGIKPDNLIGLCVGRSIEMMVGILGVLQAGAAYIPLDPDYPEGRLSYMLEDSNAGIVITQKCFKDKVMALVKGNNEVIVLDDRGCLPTEYVTNIKEKSIELQTDVTPDNLAYVVYTSGSTGQPKGVMIEHRMVVDYCYSVVDKMDLQLCNTFAAISTFSSDLGNLALYVPIMFSKTLYVFSNEYVNNPIELHNYMDSHPIDCMKITPSHFEMFKTSDTKIISPSKVLIFAGESLTKEMVCMVNTLNPNCKVFNNYGPTETTISKVVSEPLIRSNITGTTSVYLGKPLNNTQVYILDDNNRPVPIGVPGEIHITGDGVARGYLNRPELTEEKFIVNPFNSEARMYKSGDLACWLDDGNIEYLGRVDTQVKIRGFRIETAEIEAVLNLHPQIKSSVVVAQEQGNDSGTLNKQLVAFYVLSPSDINSPTPLIDSDEIKEYLLQTLPEYMLPMTFVNLDEIPLTPNGKIDRQNLELTSVNLTSGQVYVPPRNELEEKLVTIWSGILQLEPEKIGVNDDFFSLGGHSLLAVMLVSKVKKELEIALPLQALFNLKTVGGTAEYITENTTYSQPGIVLGENSNVEEETVEGVL